jgi:hypothetical protein
MSRAKARLSRRKLVPRSTPPMFNFIFSSIQAYTQIGLFLGALVCVGLGGLILGNSLYWRVHALRGVGRDYRRYRQKWHVCAGLPLHLAGRTDPRSAIGYEFRHDSRHGNRVTVLSRRRSAE